MTHKYLIIVWSVADFLYYTANPVSGAPRLCTQRHSVNVHTGFKSRNFKIKERHL